MTTAVGSALDTQALAWLDRLLDTPADLRATALGALRRETPALQRRVLRMLRAAETGGGSRPLRQPVVAGCAAAHEPIGRALQTGASIAGYRLISELGRGGMSVVWRAERADGAVRRQVALKMPALTLSTPVEAARFERERAVLAMLAHPGIARLYDVVVCEAGQPFIVMELVDGLPLTEACAAQRLGLRQRLQLFLKVLSAVGYAHQHLVVHRDLKPSNILVDAEGQPKLLDFGIAKLLDAGADTLLTQAHGCALTPRYAAPEQATGAAISTATDVYALGVLLYELLSGALPGGDGEASAADLIEALLHRDPCPPSQAALDQAAWQSRRCHGPAALRALLAGDLDTIVLKALRKAPQDRYASVEALADDIRRWLDHRPIHARPPTLLHRTRLLWRRHRVAGVALAAGLVVAGASAALALQQYRHSQASRERADAVREFMFDVLEEAEPDDQQPGGAGPRLLDAALERANIQFRDEPRRRGEVLSELGQVYGRLGDSARAMGLLQAGLVLLEAHAPAGDAQLAKARARLADRLWAADEPARAVALATQALQGCEGGGDCAKAHYYARNLLVHQARAEGRLADALAGMQQAVRNAEAAFGRRHAETAVAWQSLAVVARQAGRLDLAAPALAQALSSAEGVALRRADRVELARTAALLSLDLGRLADADARLQVLLAQPDVDDRERGLLWRLEAQLQLARGQAPLARASGQRAATLAASGDDAVGAWLSRQAEARAEAMLGLPDAALHLQQVVNGLQEAGYAPNAMEVLRARRMLAEAQARRGDLATAQALLRDVSARQAEQEATQALEWAQTLDLSGWLAQRQGQWAAARAAHRQAERLLSSRLPPDHYLRQRNAFYSLSADASGDADADRLAARATAAHDIAQGLPPDSVWRSRLAAAPSGPAAVAELPLF